MLVAKHELKLKWPTHNMAQMVDHWQALVNTMLNLQVPQEAKNLLSSWATKNFPRWTMLYGVSAIKYRYHRM